jgi:hypothetical protein
MTQQYLAGEFSLLLAQLQAVATDPSSARALARLRREVESRPPAALAVELIRAFEVMDDLCLESLARGDAPAFDSQAASVARLREFGVCAGLLEDVELG